MLLQEIGRMWNDIAEPGDSAHLQHGAKVQRVYNAKGARVGALMAYLSKYVSKESDGSAVTDEGQAIDVGRCWGIWGTLPQSVVTCTMSAVDYRCFLRRLRRWSDNPYAANLTEKWQGWLLFGDGYTMCLLLRGLASVRFASIYV